MSTISLIYTSYVVVNVYIELMDEDLKAALFDDVDDDGQEFEELDDGFVLEVCTHKEMRLLIIQVVYVL